MPRGQPFDVRVPERVLPRLWQRDVGGRHARIDIAMIFDEFVAHGELDFLEGCGQTGGGGSDRGRQVRPERLGRSGAARDRRENSSKCLGHEVVGVSARRPTGHSVRKVVVAQVQLAKSVVVTLADECEQGDSVEVAKARRTRPRWHAKQASAGSRPHLCTLLQSGVSFQS